MHVIQSVCDLQVAWDTTLHHWLAFLYESLLPPHAVTHPGTFTRRRLREARSRAGFIVSLWRGRHTHGQGEDGSDGEELHFVF